MSNNNQVYVYVKIVNEFGTFCGIGTHVSEDDANALYDHIRDVVTNGRSMSVIMSDKECMFFPAEIMKKSLVTIHVSKQEDSDSELSD